MSVPALRPTFAELEGLLAAEGFAPGPDGPAAAPDASDDPPWFTRVLVGVGAWISALLLLCFAGFLFASSIEDVGLVLGAILVGAGTLVLRTSRGPDGAGLFARQCALAATLAGEGLFVFGASKLSHGDLAPALAGLAIAAVVAAFAREPVARFLSTCGAAFALGWVLAVEHAPRAFDVLALVLGAATAWAWLTRPARLERRGEDTLAPVSYALALSFLSTLLIATRMGPLSDWRFDAGLAPPGRPSAIGLGLGAVALALAIRRELRLGPPTPIVGAAMAALALLGPVTPGSPGLVGAAGVLLLALHRRAPILVGMAVVFLFAFLGAFYYMMETTLLAKAAYLSVTGAALLGAAFAISRRRRA
jgi:hypothetical protein